MRIVERSVKSSEMEKLFDWRIWIKKIPYLSFKPEWLVKAIPPFGGAMIRYQISHKDNSDVFVSIYLDCFNSLGYYGEVGGEPEPYWEIYPVQYEDYEDTARFDMNDTQGLLECINTEFDKQLKNGRLSQ